MLRIKKRNSIAKNFVITVLVTIAVVGIGVAQKALPKEPTESVVLNLLCDGVVPQPTTHPLIAKNEELVVENAYIKEELASRSQAVQREEYKKKLMIKVINNNIGGKLQGKGEVIYKASIANKYPPYLMTAITMQETGGGRDKKSVLYSHNNMGGIFNPKTDTPKHYDNVDQSVYDMAERIKKYYVDEGLTDIEKFGKKYCPVGVANDPKNLNKHWIPNVQRNYIKLINESEGLV